MQRIILQDTISLACCTPQTWRRRRIGRVTDYALHHLDRFDVNVYAWFFEFEETIFLFGQLIELCALNGHPHQMYLLYIPLDCAIHSRIIFIMPVKINKNVRNLRLSKLWVVDYPSLHLVFSKVVPPGVGLVVRTKVPLNPIPHHMEVMVCSLHLPLLPKHNFFGLGLIRSIFVAFPK